MSRSTDHYFQRAGKLVRKPHSRLGTPRGDTANAPPYLPLGNIQPARSENSDDVWWPLAQQATVGRVLAGAAAALSASVALTAGFNSHNDEIVPQAAPSMGGSHVPTVRSSGPNLIRWWQNDEIPSGGVPAFVSDEDGSRPSPALPPAPMALPAQHQDDLPPQAATLADDAPDWFPGAAIVQAPVVCLWGHQDERAPTLIEEGQWPHSLVTLRADPLAILWATDEDAIQASGMEEEPWPPPAALAAWLARPLPAWQDELGTPAATPALAEDDWRASMLPPWLAPAQPWPSDEFQPVELAEEDWRAPAPLAASVASLPQPGDDFAPPPFALDDDPWFAPAPQRWAVAAASFWADDEFAKPALDEEPWIAFRQPAPSVAAAAWLDDDFVAAVAASVLLDDDTSWVPAPMAPPIARALPAADDDWAPRAAVDEDAGWQAPAPLPPSLAATPAWATDEIVPQPAAPALIDDEWQAPTAVGQALQPDPQWPDDAFSTVVLADDAWQALAPLPSAPAALQPWDDGAAVQQPVALAEEVYEFRPLVLQAWSDLRVWTHQDEWPTPLVPLPFDEEPWITFPPVLLPPAPAFFPPGQPSDDEFPALVTPVEPPAPGPSLLGGRRIVRIPRPLMEARRVGQLTDDDLLLLIAGAVAAGLLG